MSGTSGASGPTSPHGLADVAAAEVPPPARTTAYGPDPAQVYDVREPAGPGAPRGTVAVVHGGFWRAEHDRAHAAAQAQALAEEGWVVAVVEYRRTGMPGGGWPGTLEDVRTALTAVAADPDLPGPLLAVGHSAGGHLALWAASQADTPLDGVVALGGCVDLATSARLDLGDGATQRLMGGGPDEVPDRYATADPAQLLPARVPVVLVHGTADDRVPVEISHSYAALAAGSTRPVTVEELPGVGHYELIDPRDPAFARVLHAVASLAA